jgi:hypothetical protein
LAPFGGFDANSPITGHLRRGYPARLNGSAEFKGFKRLVARRGRKTAIPVSCYPGATIAKFSKPPALWADEAMADSRPDVDECS